MPRLASSIAYRNADVVLHAPRVPARVGLDLLELAERVWEKRMHLFGSTTRHDTSSGVDIGLLRALMATSEADPLYADVYLDRAEQLLTAVCPQDRYGELRHEREHLRRAVDELRRVADAGEWSRVHELAVRTAAEQDDVARAREILEVADYVYGARIVRATTASLGLHGVVPLPAFALERERERAIEQLRVLAEYDANGAAFYRGRIREFERLEVVAPPDLQPAATSDLLRIGVRAALDRGDFAEVGRLTGDAHNHSGARSVRTHALMPANGSAEALAAPFPGRCRERARDFGLVEHTLPSVPSADAYLSCCCADRATLPPMPLDETHRAVHGCTCGHPCPPDVSAVLRDVLDLLLLHPFLSSGGSRYLPWFGRETILIEDFPETAPEAPTRLLDALGLPRRCGVSRLAIEHAVRSHTRSVCESLGLDPLEFVVACVPFDAYVRLGPSQGWGRQQRWTHFDGYQVTRELRLRGLVGGDVRFGGEADLCAVQRDYDVDRLVARFAVLRRDRFTVRRGCLGSPIDEVGR